MTNAARDQEARSDRRDSAPGYVDRATETSTVLCRRRSRMVAVWVVESECSCRRLLFRCFLFTLGREEIGQPRQEQGDGLAQQRQARRAIGRVVIGFLLTAVLAGHAACSVAESEIRPIG